MQGEPPTKASRPNGAVFLSYASQDAEAAKHICGALRAAGIEVWFDREELRGGDAWDRQIRAQIHECRLFMPIVSANTEARIEGYFRREWKLAVNRTHDLSERVPFLVPVVIDSTSEQKADVPDRFRHVQWTRLSGGETSPAFVERVRGLLTPDSLSAPVASPQPSVSGATQASAMSTRTPRPYKPALWLISGAIVLALAYFVVDRFWLSKRAALPPASTTVASRPTAPAVPEKSIAVLPFVDLSEKHDQEYFADGMAEELIDLLARIPDLRVSARTSSFYFKGKTEDVPTIAQRLGVANILEGSVRKAGDTLRVTVQLIRANGGYHLWSSSYDRDLKDIFKVQDDIAGAVVVALQAQLAPRPQIASGHRTSNLEAYNQYLLGRQFLNRGTSDGFQRATEAYRKAVALDRDYTAAYAGLAFAEYYLADDVGDPVGFDRASAAAEKAVALAPQQADGYAARGFVRFAFNWDWNAARADLEKALAINARDSDTLRRYSQLLGALGQQEQAVAAARKAIELDPLSAGAWKDLGIYLTAAGQFAAAQAALDRALEITPESNFVLMALGKLELLEGKAAEARATFEQSSHATVRLFGTAAAEHTLGHTPKSQQALNKLIEERAQDPYQTAEVYAWRGEKDKALEWLQRAYRQRDGGLIQVKTDPMLASVRGDPRYSALLREINLPE